MKIAYYRGSPGIAEGATRVMLMRVGPPYAPPGEAAPVMTPEIIRVDPKTRAIHTRGVTYLPEKGAIP